DEGCSASSPQMKSTTRMPAIVSRPTISGFPRTARATACSPITTRFTSRPRVQRDLHATVADLGRERCQRRESPVERRDDGATRRLVPWGGGRARQWGGPPVRALRVSAGDRLGEFPGESDRVAQARELVQPPRFEQRRGAERAEPPLDVSYTHGVR